MAAGARVGIADGLALVGAALSVYGVGLVSVAAGVIVAGVVLVALSVVVALRHG